jgi:hypothetical protein
LASFFGAAVGFFGATEVAEAVAVGTGFGATVGFFASFFTSDFTTGSFFVSTLLDFGAAGAFGAAGLSDGDFGSTVAFGAGGAGGAAVFGASTFGAGCGATGADSTAAALPQLGSTAAHVGSAAAQVGSAQQLTVQHFVRHLQRQNNPASAVDSAAPSNPSAIKPLSTKRIVPKLLYEPSTQIRSI